MPDNGFKHSDASRRQMSESARRRFADPEQAKQRSESQRRIWATRDPDERDAHLKKLANSVRGHAKRTEAQKQAALNNLAKANEKRKALTDTQREQEHRRRIATFRKLHGTPTKLEETVAKRLCHSGITYERYVQIGPYEVDFLFADNIVLEVDGCFWHACEACGFGEVQHARKARAHDQNKAAYLRAHGYLVMRIAEHDVLPVRGGMTQCGS